jgi:hypothetical protein
MPSLASPASASPGVSTPASNNSVRPPTITASAGNRLLASKPMQRATTPRVSQASQIIPGTSAGRVP